VTVYLTAEDLIALAVINQTPVLRDRGLLDSAAARPRSSAFGVDAYPDLHTKAAALLESLVRNHALVDGNKRLGWLATAVFHRRNGYLLRAPDDLAYDLVIGVAEVRLDLVTVADKLKGWTVDPR
jgi:death-on-curing protein